MNPPYELHLALRYLRFHRGRTFLSVISLISVVGVTVGTAALVIALALMSGFQEGVRERILRGSAHLTVMSATEPTFENAESVLGRIEALEGVRAAGPVLFTPAMVLHEKLGATAYAELLGVVPERHGQVVSFAGPELFAALEAAGEDGLGGIALGEELASQLVALPGDRVRVLVPRLTLSPFSALPRSRVFRVVGTFRTDAYPQDAQRAYVGLEASRSLLRLPGGASWIEVRLGDLREVERMKPVLRGELGGSWSVVDLIEQNRDLLLALNTEKLILFLAIGLIVVVAALNIVSTLILMVADKIKEIGTLSAMGARPASIAAVFVLQGVVIGLTGASLGLGLGVGVSDWLDRYQVIELNPEVYYLSYVPFTPRPLDLTFVGTLVLGVSFLATLYPAWRAATLDPVEAIRYE